MIIDIHSHHIHSNTKNTILNLSFNEAKNQLTRNSSGLYSVGIHPWHADGFSKEKLANMRDIISLPQVVLIGETGLDKKCNIAFSQQLLAFTHQIEISEVYKKPMIIHCVGYYNELFEIKKQLRSKELWIIHGFRGKPELALQAMKNGCALSYGEQFNIDAVKATPLEKLYVETDDSSISIKKIYQQIAEIKNCKINEINAGYHLILPYINLNTL